MERNEIEAIENGEKALKVLLDACRKYKEGLSWNYACRECGLDSKKAKRAVNQAIRCSFTKPPMAVEFGDMHDGDEKFYIAVFGDRSLDIADMPDDYEESIEHVLSSLDPIDAYILKNHYGIGGVEAKSLKAIGDYLGIAAVTVQTKEKNAIRRCRMHPNLSVLRDGLRSHMEQEAMRKAECEAKKRTASENRKMIEKEYAARMEKLESDHETRMAAIQKGCYEKALSETLAKDIIDELYRTELSALDLRTGAHNRLIRSGISSVGRLLRIADKDMAKNVRGVGYKYEADAKNALDEYVKEHYGVDMDTLRLALFPKD